MKCYSTPDDNELKEIYRDCREGNNMCGKSKQNAAELVEKFIQKLSQKREKARDMAESILS